MTGGGNLFGVGGGKTVVIYSTSFIQLAHFPQPQRHLPGCLAIDFERK